MAVHWCLAAWLPPKVQNPVRSTHGEDNPVLGGPGERHRALDAVEDKHEHVLITRNGRPSAVMLSADEYEWLDETLDILQDKDLLESLRKSEDDVRAGRVTSLDDLRRKKS